MIDPPFEMDRGRVAIDFVRLSCLSELASENERRDAALWIVGVHKRGERVKGII